ncbi:hypothetical protein EV126DRAFT_109189 [Verticillium dahliae]|nr:hypothetical protein EV126DRAFT_109189 [Verticillium dahliae]
MPLGGRCRCCSRLATQRESLRCPTCLSILFSRAKVLAGAWATSGCLSDSRCASSVPQSGPALVGLCFSYVSASLCHATRPGGNGLPSLDRASQGSQVPVVSLWRVPLLDCWIRIPVRDLQGDGTTRIPSLQCGNPGSCALGPTAVGKEADKQTRRTAPISKHRPQSSLDCSCHPSAQPLATRR